MATIFTWHADVVDKVTCQDTVTSWWRVKIRVTWQLRILWRLGCALVGRKDCLRITWDYWRLGKADLGLVYKHSYSHYYFLKLLWFKFATSRRTTWSRSLMTSVWRNGYFRCTASMRYLVCYEIGYHWSGLRQGIGCVYCGQMVEGSTCNNNFSRPQFQSRFGFYAWIPFRWYLVCLNRTRFEEVAYSCHA